MKSLPEISFSELVNLNKWKCNFLSNPAPTWSGLKSGKQIRIQWHLDNGIRKNKLRFHEHGAGELAHYAKAAFDIEYEFPFGWQELEGIHNRTDFDLGRHQQFSGKKLNILMKKKKNVIFLISLKLLRAVTDSSGRPW